MTSRSGRLAVGVTCTPDALRAREAGRGDRPPGWAEEQLRTVFDGIELDVLVDTSDLTSTDAAESVRRSLEGDEHR